ncbi:MAG: c-type heme family protein [Thermodesulfobacteriota bacterium]
MAAVKQTGMRRHLTPSGMQMRFMLGLAFIFFFFCVCIAALIYFHEKKMLEEEAFNQTELVMAAVDSLREYVRGELRPRMYELLDDQTFVIEAMSTSYISRAVMDRFNRNMPSFSYRRVAIQARNPDYEANELERRMIDYFAENKDLDHWRGIVNTPTGRYYISFRPVRFSGSCFHCHGEPEDAPRYIVENYGSVRGFHKQRDAVGGVQSVAIPVDFDLAKVMEVAWTVFSVAFLVVFSLYGIIWFFFNKVVVQSLRQLLDSFRENLRDEKGMQLYEQARSKDEIFEMSLAVQSMAQHLRETHRKLEDYAENLEQMVAERTSALENSQQRLRQKVKERSQELRTLNIIAELITQSVRLADILPRVLEQTLKAFPASGAGIYLLDREMAVLRLQCRQNAAELDEEISFEPTRCLPLLEEQGRDFDGFIRQAACAYIDLAGSEPALLNSLNVPLCCRNEVLGVMTFLGIDSDELDAQQHELLFSIGHQIGVTIESLQNTARLLESKELLQSVFDGITDVLVLLDREQRIRMVNRAFLLRHDIALEEVLNRPLTALSLKHSCPFSFCRDFPALTSTNVTVEQVRTEDGLIYEVSIYPILSERGRVRNIVCIAKDITEQKEVEQTIQQAEKLFSLGQLAAGVAHEINNPLGVILCYADILKEEMGEETAHWQDVEVIEKHARSCQRIVADLLNFARSQRSDKNSCGINEVIEEVVAVVRQQFLKKGISITEQLAPDLPQLLLDRDRMRQVFLNLLMNASHAIVEQGDIRIISELLAEEDRVEVVVEDTGSGIQPELLARIFDPFFTTKPQGSGTGLGLSVSYGIIRDHNGEIRVESRPGERTRFIISLPVHNR